MQSTSERAAWKSSVAGLVGGFCGLTATHPIDTVKLRLQNPQIQRYDGMVDCVRQTLRQEGALAMYRGLLPPALGYGAINAVAFSTNTALVNAIGGDKRKLSGLEKSVCGGMAGASSAIVRSPVERVKTVMQTSKLADGRSPFTSDLHCARDLWKAGGHRSLFQGFHGCVGREVGQFALYFQIYDATWGMLLKSGQQRDEVGPYYALLAGGVAGALPWIPTYPLDVLKSRVQAAPVGTATLTSVFRDILAKEGPQALFRGLSPALIRAFPLHGLIFTFYELSLKFLDRTFPAHSQRRTFPIVADHGHNRPQSA